MTVILDPKDPTGERQYTREERKILSRIDDVVKETRAQVGPPKRGSWEPPDPSTLQPGECHCGCGEFVARGSRSEFKPGHRLRDKTYRESIGMLTGNVERLRKTTTVEGEILMPRRRRKPISRAFTELMDRPYPGDPLHRTGAEILALAVFKAAAQGDIAAANMIADRVEGKPDQSIEVDVTEGMDVYEKLRYMVAKLRGANGGGNQSALPGTGDGLSPDLRDSGEGPAKE